MNGNEAVVLNSQQLLFQKIKESSPVSKQQLRTDTGLSWAVVSDSVNKLVDTGYIVPYGKQQSQGAGRKADEYDINSQKNYFIGIDLNDMGVLCVVTDMKGRIVKQYEKEFALRERDHVLEQLYGVIDKFFEEFQSNQILGIGIAAQGVVDLIEGKSICIHKIKNWDNVPLKELFEERYGVMTNVLHDPDCLMKTETVFGCLKSSDVSNTIMVFISHRTGIGMSIMINDQIYHGCHGKSGEIGYTIVRDEENNSVGLLEEYVTKAGILREYSRIKQEDEEINYREFVERLQNGDEICSKVYKQLGEYIGFAVSSAANFLNPELIVIHASHCDYPEILYETISDFVTKNTYDKTVELRLSGLGRSAIAIGSALTAIEKAIQKI